MVVAGLRSINLAAVLGSNALLYAASLVTRRGGERGEGEAFVEDPEQTYVMRTFIGMEWNGNVVKVVVREISHRWPVLPWLLDGFGWCASVTFVNFMNTVLLLYVCMYVCRDAYGEGGDDQ